jgi:hypothetical protein
MLYASHFRRLLSHFVLSPIDLGLNIFRLFTRGPDLVSTRNQVSAEEIYDVIF